jgi:mRNA interferase MazF
VICDLWQVAVVPFPFSEALGAKRRPALALSHPSFNREGITVFAMITSRFHRPWPGDSLIQDLEPVGLTRNCIVRLKLFTLDNRLILHSLGTLSHRDRETVLSSLGTFFANRADAAEDTLTGGTSDLCEARS